MSEIIIEDGNMNLTLAENTFKDVNPTKVYIGRNIESAVFGENAHLAALSIGNKVTFIGNNAFQGCSSLTTISIPSSVRSIGDSAFCGCSSLTSISIPSFVTFIGDSAFSDCSSLTSISIPKSVISIGNSAFSGCSSLTSISIPKSVRSIGDSAFRDCSNILSILCHSKEPITCKSLTFDDEIFYSAVLYVPIGSKEKYCNSIPWYKFNNIVEKEMDD
jgi:hypothetical protein